MNAPKILWYDDQECSAGPVQFGDGEVKYVRADLVNWLVKALEMCVKHLDADGNLWSKEDQAMALAALKALESAEIGRGME
jgi:hypothetical protein